MTSVDERDGAGRLVAGRYRLGPLIGAGDLGTVWRATDELLRRTVAVKRLTGPDARDRALHEARMGGQVDHPRLLRVLDVLDSGGGTDAWLVVQYVQAAAWSSLWQRFGPVAVPAAAHIGAQVAEALVALHGAGLVHGDVTADNILVDPDGEVKLVDFGASRMAVDTSPAARMTGVRDHRAPEVEAGAEPGPAADVYALGAVVYEAVTGATPPVPVDAGDVPDAVAALLAVAPRQRPDAAGARDLLRGLAG